MYTKAPADAGANVSLILGDFQKRLTLYTKKIFAMITRYNLDDGTGFHYEIASHPKTEAGNRSVYLPKEAYRILNWMKSRSGEYIFMDQGHRLTVSAIRSKLYRICKKIGVERKKPT